MKNRVCEILGIEKPVIQGPMVWLTDARLAAFYRSFEQIFARQNLNGQRNPEKADPGLADGIWNHHRKRGL